MGQLYDNELTLLSYKLTEDDIGNNIKVPVRNTILCKVKSIGSTEFYNAQVNSLKPEIKFIIHSFEYNGEKEVEFKGVKYQVIRNYDGDTVDRSDNSLSGEEIELTCEKVVGGGN